MMGDRNKFELSNRIDVTEGIGVNTQKRLWTIFENHNLSIIVLDEDELDILSTHSPRFQQLFEALKRLRAASLCDICYEDKCDPWLCDCKCHTEIGEANEQADFAIAAVEGNNHVQK